MGRAFKLGFALGLAGVTAKLLWDRPWSPELPPSSRLDTWVPGAQFRDLIARGGVRASEEAVFQAFREVRLGDMPLATWLGELRYAPGRLAGEAAGGGPERPFLDMLLQDSGNLILEGAQGPELVIGAIGRLHDPVNQEFVALEGPEAFLAFHRPGYEKLAMSLRVLGEDPAAGLTLVLEHRTLALDEDARRRFGLYWLGIKPGGAFVTGQLLAAVARRAEALAAGQA